MSFCKHVWRLQRLIEAAHRSSHYGGEVALGLNRAHGSVNLPSSLVFPRPLSSGRHSSHAAAVARGSASHSHTLWCNAAAIFAPICLYRGTGVQYNCVREDPKVLFLPGSEFTRIIRIMLGWPIHVKALYLISRIYGRGSRRRHFFLSRPVLTWCLTQDGL
jgi:hypothetical protein